jgi:hypothetical protein
MTEAEEVLKNDDFGKVGAVGFIQLFASALQAT